MSILVDALCSATARDILAFVEKKKKEPKYNNSQEAIALAEEIIQECKSLIDTD